CEVRKRIADTECGSDVLGRAFSAACHHPRWRSYDTHRLLCALNVSRTKEIHRIAVIESIVPCRLDLFLPLGKRFLFFGDGRRRYGLVSCLRQSELSHRRSEGESFCALNFCLLAAVRRAV